MTVARAGRATLARLALADFRDASAWIARDNPVAADSFRRAVGHAAGRIGAYPEIGQVRPDLAAGRFRFLPLRGFPYVLVYEAEPTPRILRVLHGARDLPDILAGLRD